MEKRTVWATARFSILSRSWSGLAQRLQVHRGIFATTIDLDVEFEPVALVDRGKTGALDRRNMNEGIRLAVIAADKAEALHRVKELDGALGLFTGQLTLRAAESTTASAS